MYVLCLYLGGKFVEINSIYTVQMQKQRLEAPLLNTKNAKDMKAISDF